MITLLAASLIGLAEPQANSAIGAPVSGNDLAASSGATHATTVDVNVNQPAPSPAVVQFDVEKTGKASNCRIVQTSGSKEHDRMACALVEQRGTFTIPKDANGNPRPSGETVQFNWHTAKPER